MVSYFHASGHLPHTKSAHLYLQSMTTLSSKIPSTEFIRLTEEMYFITIRRTDKFWTGLSSDQVIGPTLMQSMTSVGGITRGRIPTEGMKTQ